MRSNVEVKLCRRENTLVGVNEECAFISPRPSFMTAAVETVGGHWRAVYVRAVRVESYYDVGNYLAGDRYLRGKYL